MYNELLGSFNMLQTVNFPRDSKITTAQPLIIYIVNNSRLHLCSILPTYNRVSDHDAQCLIFIEFFVKKKIMSGKFKALFTADTISYFQGLLLKETLEVIHQEHDINKIFNNFF